jgi:predicted outer membrane repeat protein
VNNKIIGWFIIIITLISVVPANALYPTIPLSSNENALPFTFTNQSTGNNNSTLINQSTINSNKSGNYYNNGLHNYQISDYYNESYNYIIDSNASSNSDNDLYIDPVDDNHDDHGINISINDTDNNNGYSDDNNGYSDDNNGYSDDNNDYSINDTPVDINYSNNCSDINYVNKSVNKEHVNSDNDNYYSDNDTPVDINYSNNCSDINYSNKSKSVNDNKEPVTNDNDSYYSDGDPNVDLPDFSLNQPCADIIGLRFFDDHYAKLNGNINIDSLLSSYSLTDGYYYINGQGHTIYFNDLSLFLRVYKNAIVVFENVNFVASGGSFIHNYGTVICVNCTFTGFSSKHDNGCVFYNDDGVLILVNSVFKNNTSKSGGVIYNTSNGAVYLQSCIFDGNSGSVNGGAIYSDAGFIGIIGSVFDNNKAINGGAISAVNSCIWASNSIIYIVDKTFFDIFGNIVDYLSSGSPSYTSHIFNSNVFNNNKADYGGAVSGAMNTFLFLDNTFFINNKSIYGAAIYLTSNSLVYTFNSLFKNNSAFKGGSLYLDGNYDFNIYNTVFTDNIDSFISNIFGMGLYGVRGPGKIFRDNIDITDTLFNSVVIEYLNDIIPGFAQGLMVAGFIVLGVTLITLGNLLITLSVVAAAFSVFTFGLTAPLAITLAILGIMLIGIGTSLITSAVIGLGSGSLNHAYDIDGKWNNWVQALVFGCLLSAIIAVTLLSIFLPPVAGVGLAALTVSWLGLGSGIGGTIVSFIITGIVVSIQSLPMIGLMVLCDICGPYLHIGLSKVLFFTLFFSVITMIAINPIISLKNGINLVGNFYTVIVGFSSVIVLSTLLIIATISDNPIYGRILMYLLAAVSILLSGASCYQNIMRIENGIKEKILGFNFKYTVINNKTDYIKFIFSSIFIVSGVVSIDYLFNHNKNKIAYILMVLMVGLCQCVESIESQPLINYIVPETGLKNTRNIERDMIYASEGRALVICNKPKPIHTKEEMLELLNEYSDEPKPIVKVPDTVEPPIVRIRPAPPKYYTTKNWDWILAFYRDQVIEIKKIAEIGFSNVGLVLDNTRLFKMGPHTVSPHTFFNFIINAKFSLNGYAYYDGFEKIEFIELRKILRENYNYIEPEKIKNRLSNFHKIMLELNAQDIQPIAAIKHFISDHLVSIGSDYSYDRSVILKDRVINRLYKDGLFVEDQPLPLLPLNFFDPVYYQGRNEPFLLDKTDLHSVVYFLPEIDGYIDLFNKTLDRVGSCDDRICFGSEADDFSHIRISKAISRIFYFNVSYIKPPIIFNGELTYFYKNGNAVYLNELKSEVENHCNDLNMITQFNDHGFTFTVDKDRLLRIKHPNVQGDDINSMIKQTEDTLNYLDSIKSDFCKYVDKFILYDNSRVRTFITKKTINLNTIEKMLLKYIGNHDHTQPNFNLDALDLYNFFIVVKDLQNTAIFNKFMGKNSPLFKQRHANRNTYIIQGNEFTLPQLWDYIIDSRVSPDGHFHPRDGSGFNPIPVSDVYNFLSINFKHLRSQRELLRYNICLRVTDKIRVSFNQQVNVSILIHNNDKCFLTVRKALKGTKISFIPVDYGSCVFNYYKHSDFTPNRIIEIINKYHIRYSTIDNLMNEYIFHAYIQPCNFINVLLYSIINFSINFKKIVGKKYN